MPSAHSRPAMHRLIESAEQAVYEMLEADQALTV